MQFKTGVELTGLRPEMVAVLSAVEETYRYTINVEPVCTSGTERATKHKRSSKHYCGAALDFRIKDSATGVIFSKPILATLQAGLLTRLTAEFDVVLESDHFHIEYDPKGG